MLVTDIEMPHMTGLELAGELKRLKSATRTIIVTTFARPGYLRRAMDAGVLGYLLKDGPAAELASAFVGFMRANESSIPYSRSMRGASPIR